MGREVQEETWKSAKDSNKHVNQIIPVAGILTLIAIQSKIPENASHDSIRSTRSTSAFWISDQLEDLLGVARRVANKDGRNKIDSQKQNSHKIRADLGIEKRTKRRTPVL
jgi:hypothetical protein